MDSGGYYIVQMAGQDLTKLTASLGFPNLMNPPMASVAKDLQAFKREYRKSGSVRSSALAAGYSKNVANSGLAHLPKNIKTYVLTRQKKLSKLAQLARNVTPEDQEMTVRGALLANVAQGKDQAVNSLKLLGQDKRVSMFTPDSVNGVIVIQAAPIPSFPTLPE
jgi:hypothetical protein